MENKPTVTLDQDPDKTEGFDIPLDDEKPPSDETNILENQPITKILRGIIFDPITPKLASIGFSIAIVLVFATQAYWRDYKIPYFIVNGATIGYFIFNILVEVLKKEEAVVESNLVKKVFHGRRVYWHEIHACASVALLGGQLSTLVFLGNTMYSWGISPIFIANIIVINYEWLKATKPDKDLTTEAVVPEFKCRVKRWLLTPFQKSPKFFNLLRTALFVAGFLSCWFCAYPGVNMASQMTILMLTSGTLTLAMFLPKFEKWLTCKNITKHKLATYYSILITMYALFATLFTVWGERAMFYRYSPHFYINCLPLFVVGFILSFLDLYSQAIFNCSRPIDDPTEVLGDKMPKNLPIMITNPFMEEIKKLKKLDLNKNFI